MDGVQFLYPTQLVLEMFKWTNEVGSVFDERSVISRYQSTLLAGFKTCFNSDNILPNYCHFAQRVNLLLLKEWKKKELSAKMLID